MHTQARPAKGRDDAGVVCSDVKGLTPEEAVTRLKDKGIVASTSPPYKYEGAWVTTSLWNKLEEVEATLRAITPSDRTEIENRRHARGFTTKNISRRKRP